MSHARYLFVIGQGRSGTSILTRLLAESPDARAIRAESPAVVAASQYAATNARLWDEDYGRHHALIRRSQQVLQNSIDDHVGWTIYEAIKARSVYQATIRPHAWRVTNVPLDDEVPLALHAIDPLATIHPIGVHRHPLDVLASRLRYTLMPGTALDHIHHIVARSAQFETLPMVRIKYDLFADPTVLLSTLRTHTPLTLPNRVLNVLNRPIRATGSQRDEAVQTIGALRDTAPASFAAFEACIAAYEAAPDVDVVP